MKTRAKTKDLPPDLKKLRALIGYVGTRADIARELDVTTPTINRWFAQQSLIPSKYFSRLARLSDGIFQVQDFIRE